MSNHRPRSQLRAPRHSASADSDFEAGIQDPSGSVRVSWLNQPFLRDVVTAGEQMVLFGLVEMRGHGGLQLTNPHTRFSKTKTPTRSIRD